MTRKKALFLSFQKIINVIIASRVKNMTKEKYFVIFSALVLLCLFNAGCATMGAATGGLFDLTNTLVKLPFDILGKVLDFVSKMPKPPPGVFF